LKEYQNAQGLNEIEFPKPPSRSRADTIEFFFVTQPEYTCSGIFEYSFRRKGPAEQWRKQVTNE